MNNFGTKAEIVLNHGHFQVKTPGDFVECSITGEKITLENLKYWNVEPVSYTHLTLPTK